jgi:hypothetical protein
MRLTIIGICALAFVLGLPGSARAELRHVEVKTLGMD